jgi:hypothetical protein
MKAKSFHIEGTEVNEAIKKKLRGLLCGLCASVSKKNLSLTETQSTQREL